MTAFFLPLDADGERWQATGHTAGPWSAQAQHGGPPSAAIRPEHSRPG